MKEKQAKTDEHDQILGQALKRSLSSQTVGDVCPSSEELAELVDQTIEPNRRDALMGHLAGCDRCYQIFSATREVVNDKKRQAGKYKLYASLAAAVVVVVTAAYLSFLLQKPADNQLIAGNKASEINVSQGPLTLSGKTPSKPVADFGQIDQGKPVLPADAAALLALHDNGEKLAEQIVLRKDTAYGFSNTLPTEKLMFRIGLLATDVEVLLKGADHINVMEHLRNLVMLLKQRKAFTQNVTTLSGIIGQLEKGAPLAQFSGCTNSLTSSLAPGDERLYFGFGVWTESGRLAAQSQNRLFLKTANVHYFQEQLKVRDLPAGLFSAMADIEKAALAISSSGTVEEAFADIIRMM